MAVQMIVQGPLFWAIWEGHANIAYGDLLEPLKEGETVRITDDSGNAIEAVAGEITRISAPSVRDFWAVGLRAPITKTAAIKEERWR